MKIAVNRCWGGFGLSHKAVMLYAKLSGFKLYPFVEKRDSSGMLKFDRFEPYKGGHALVIHYSKKPLLKDGTYAKDSYFSADEIKRNDSTLIKVIETLGKEASGSLSEIEIVEIPDGIEYEIDDYDGMETVHEKHRSW